MKGVIMNKILITGLLMFQASTCFAQETYDLGEIYVSAGFQDININKTGSSVKVLPVSYTHLTLPTNDQV